MKTKVIKIAICDDEVLWAKTAEDIIYDFFKGRFTEPEIDIFNNTEDLICRFANKEDAAQILILDIDMPDMNGFEAAKKIKELYPDIILMFYTQHEQYVFESFKFQPFRYIRKRFAAAELKIAMEAALVAVEANSEKNIILKTPNETLNICTDEIKYFETNKRKCDVYLRDGRTVTVRKTIRDLYSELGESSFVLIHRWAVVNIRYIKSYSGFDVTLEDGTRLIVSRKYIKDVRTAMIKYWGRRL